MNTITKLALTVALLITFAAASVKAEQTNIYTDWGTGFGNLFGYGGAQGKHNATTGNSTTGAWFKDTEGNPLYLTSPSFHGAFTTEAAATTVSGSNVKWNASVTSLGDSPYSAVQQAQIQSLYDHVYYKAYNESTPTAGQFVQNTYLANALAHSLEAILHSGTDLTSSIYMSSGKYYMVGVSGYTIDSAMATLLKSWFTAISTDGWDLLDGYAENKVTVTSYQLDYKNSHVNMFGVSAYTGVPTDPTDPSTATPEPATMLILGLGVAGLAVSRRLRRK